MTRLLLINPNISDSVTQLMADEARRSASADTLVTALTAPTGVAYIETRFEALLGAHTRARCSRPSTRRRTTPSSSRPSAIRACRPSANCSTSR